MGGSLIHDLKRPDVDNMTKYILDSLEGIMYANDDQVVRILTTKFVDTSFPYNGKTVVNVYKAEQIQQMRVITPRNPQRAPPGPPPFQFVDEIVNNTVVDYSGEHPTGIL